MPRGRQGCVFHMVVAAVVCTQTAQKEHRAAPCTAKHMEVEKGAFLLVALKVQREVLPYVKATEVVSAAFSMVVGFAQRVYMVGLTIVLPMVEESAVQFRAAQRVHEGGLILV